MLCEFDERGPDSPAVSFSPVDHSSACVRFWSTLCKHYSICFAIGCAVSLRMPFAHALIPREHGARRICAERTGSGGAALVAAHRKRACIAIDLGHFERIARAERTIEHRFHRAAKKRDLLTRVVTKLSVSVVGSTETPVPSTPRA